MNACSFCRSIRKLSATQIAVSLFALALPYLSLSSRLWADEYVDRVMPLQPVHTRSETDAEHLRAAAMIMEARILERRGELVPALRKYQRAWRYDRDARIVLKQIVPLALKLGRVDEATRYALLLTNSDLKDPFLAERVAMLMADQVEYDRSLQLYRHVLQLRNEEFQARDPIAMRFEMGRLYFLTKEYAQAAQSFHVVLDALDSPEKYELEQEVRDVLLADPERIYTLFAESFLEAGEYDEAQDLFERASKTKEEPGWLEFQMARVDYRAGRYADAQRRLESYVKQKLKLGGHTPYELLQALLEKADNKTVANATKDSGQEEDKAREGVIASFRNWLTDDPDNFPLLSYVAEMTSRRGGLVDAAKLYEKSVATQPTIEGYVGLITTYRKLRDKNKLLDLLAKTSAELHSIDLFDEEVAELVLDRALVNDLFKLGRSRLKEKIATDGDIAACGFLALKAKRYDVADEFFAELDKSPSQLELMIGWGMELLIADESERAKHVFQSARATAGTGTNESIVLFYLAAALQMEGQTDEALRTARRAAELAEDVPDISLRPAWILYNADRVDEAHREYTAWLEKYREDYSVPGTRQSVRDARFVMSNICLEKSNPEDAIEWLEQILDEFPSDVGALNDLGYLLVDQNRSLERATNMIRFAVDAEPDNVAYRDSLGWALYRRGRFSEAVDELRKASSVDTPDPIILDHLGDALLASGNQADASKVWQQAVAILEDRDEASNSDEELKLTIERKLERKTVESK